MPGFGIFYFRKVRPNFNKIIVEASNDDISIRNNRIVMNFKFFFHSFCFVVIDNTF